MIDRVNFTKMGGLVPAVVQDVDDGTVLMLGFMNQEALQRTLDEKQVTFWSRTRSRLWKKGEQSSNVLNVESVDTDCDGDTLLIRARAVGPVCHMGERSCFPSSTRLRAGSVFQDLVRVIKDRKERLPEGSYTAKLFREGAAAIGKKVGEEAVELAIAAQYTETQRCIEEAADLFYHTLVLLAEKRIELSEVYTELEKRMVTQPDHTIET